MKELNTPALYVIVRDDIASMNSGKAEAHSGHAASMLAHHMEQCDPHCSVFEMYKDWQCEYGFGTQINLQGGIEEIIAVENILNNRSEGVFEFDRVIDPTYPWQCPITGQHKVREEVTAFWFFGKGFDFLSKFKLKK